MSGFATAQAGTTELSEQLNSLLTVNVPDPTDTKWLAEKERMTAVLTAQLIAQRIPADERPAIIARELEVNKPLGREQRSKYVKENIATTTLNTAGKLTEIKQEITEGRAESRTQQIALLGQIANILKDVNSLRSLTSIQLADLGNSVGRLNAPTTYKDLGIPHRYVDNVFYNHNAGIINLMLFSRVRDEQQNDQYNYGLMVKNFARNPSTGLPAISLTSAVSALGRPGTQRRYLDLERGGLISQDTVRRIADNVRGGYDSKLFSIQKANR